MKLKIKLLRQIVCCRNLIGCYAVLHPIYQCVEQALRLWSIAPGTMRDSGRTEQSVEFLYPPEVYTLLAVPPEESEEGMTMVALFVARCHLAVIIDHPAGHNELIVRADHGDHFSAATPEFIQIAERIGEVGDVA